jgi:Lon protease-like protein
MNTTGDWLPLFPLDLALLPGALLPLHVFEPRYRALARHSLEGDRRFCVVRMHDGQLARVGCMARIDQVLQVYPDGRSDILVRGEERFSLLDLREHADGYLEARTEAVRDEPGPGPDSEDRLLLERLFRDYAQLADDDDLLGGALGAEDAAVGPGMDADADAAATADTDAAATADAHAAATADTDAAATADADRFSFALAARIPLGVDERQALLETLSERERALALLGHLARLVPRLRAHEKDRRKVRGNGKLVPAEE